MDFSSAVYFSPRPGHPPHEYKDAWAGPKRVARRIRAAVADGATETIFARAWANILVNEFVDVGPRFLLEGDRSLHTVRAAWHSVIKPDLEGVAWYADAKVERGAFAALLGLEIEESGKWMAVCVGRCCLFHVRRGSLLRAWPHEHAAAFGERPALIGSVGDGFSPKPWYLSGMSHPGEQFLLATDAAASHLLTMQRELLLACASGAVSAMAASSPAPAGDDLTLMQIELIKAA